MKSFLLAVAGVTALAATLLLSGCERAHAADTADVNRIGKGCMVQFRRDALGIADKLPTSHTETKVHNGDLQLTGTFLRTQDEWFVMRESKTGATSQSRLRIDESLS